MQFPQRSQKFEWNLNTIINIVTLATVAGGGVALWVNRSRDVDELQKWQTEQVQSNKDTSGATKAIEERVGKVESQVESLGYRVTLGEQSNASTTSSIKEVQSTLNLQSGDLRVVKEILQRIEATQKGRTP